jgi:thiamine biosynthesis lipoprotein
MKPAASGLHGIGLRETNPGQGIQRFAHEAMATLFEVRCVHDDAGYARQAAQAAFGLVDRLEQEMSRFIPNSDVSRINDLRAGESTRVSPSTLDCLQIARDLFDLTGGAFDVAVGSGLDRLDLMKDDFVVGACANGVRLDLGGIGKGYAVDRMAELLREWGIDRALVHGGFSSVVAMEPPPHRDGWALTLSAPWPGDDRVLVRLSACQKALSASGTRKPDHIVDPRTGRPVRGRAAFVSLSVPTGTEGELAGGEGIDAPTSPAAVAEGLSTAFLILANAQIEELCRGWPGVEAWVTPETLHAAGPETNLVHLPASTGEEP